MDKVYQQTGFKSLNKMTYYLRYLDLYSIRYGFLKFNQISAFLIIPGIRIFFYWGFLHRGGVLARATDLWASGQVSRHTGKGAHGHVGPGTGRERGGTRRGIGRR